MANNGITTNYDDNGFPIQAAKTFPVALGGSVNVKNGAGRLVVVTVTTVTASAAVTVYDSTGAASGTILLVIPAATAAGTVYGVNLPAAAGITVVSTGATGNVTVGYS